MDDSSDDDLPPPFPSNSPKKREIKVDDIIWAKYNGKFWPAVVRRVYPHLKKLSVAYVDNPNGRRIRIPITSAVHFASEQGRDLQSQIIDETQKDLFHKTINRVREFQCKRFVQGIKSSPIKFFENPLGFCDDAEENMEESAEENDMEEENDIGAEPLKNDRIEEEISSQTEEANQREKKIINEKQREINEKLLNLIQTENCMAHLIKILNKQISCDRHEKFLSLKTPSIRRQLKLKSGYGPIFCDQVNEILFPYLMTNLQKETSSRECFDINTYLFEVWIPEAIIWALSKNHDVTLEEADKMFNSKDYPI